MKPTETSERLKNLMRAHKANSVAGVPAVIPTAPAITSPTVAAVASPAAARPASATTQPKARWDRVTIRLPAGELQKINDVVIATQQANRWSKVTTTDILRAGLRRIKEHEAVDAASLKALREQDGRLSKAKTV